jgi:regulator of RNase E activity RraA
MHHDLTELSQLLYSAVVSDACDQAGLRDQTLTPGIRPITAAKEVLLGWARTVQFSPVDVPTDPPYASEIAFIDSLKADDVVLATSAGPLTGVWGELFSTAASARGARGAILDSYVRDSRKIGDLGFPVHALGARPADIHGRLSVNQTDITLTVREVSVTTGDFVIADLDGVTVVPAAFVDQVLEAAVAKATTETKARQRLFEGAKLGDVWNEYKVL